MPLSATLPRTSDTSGDGDAGGRDASDVEGVCAVEVGVEITDTAGDEPERSGGGAVFLESL